MDQGPGNGAEYSRRRWSVSAVFAASPAERLQWTYQRTPFYDPRAYLYPVGREE